MRKILPARGIDANDFPVFQKNHLARPGQEGWNVGSDKIFAHANAANQRGLLAGGIKNTWLFPHTKGKWRKLPSPRAGPRPGRAGCQALPLRRSAIRLTKNFGIGFDWKA